MLNYWNDGIEAETVQKREEREKIRAKKTA